MSKNEIKELVERYKLSLYGDNIRFGGTKAEFEKMIPTLKQCKTEVVEYLKEQEAERKAKYEARIAKINAIEGLSEIRAAKSDLAQWHAEFEASFDDVGGLGVRPKPDYDIDAMLDKYPVAASYLKAERYADKVNDELSTIGHKALDKIIDDPQNHLKAIEDMERDLQDFRDKHMFD